MEQLRDQPPTHLQLLRCRALLLHPWPLPFASPAAAELAAAGLLMPHGLATRLPGAGDCSGEHERSAPARVDFSIDAILARRDQSDTIPARCQQQEPILPRRDQSDATLARRQQQEPILAQCQQTDAILARCQQQEPILARCQQQEPILTRCQQPDAMLTRCQQSEAILARYQQSEAILARCQRSEAILSRRDQLADDDDQLHQEYNWVNCSRYRPPKLIRAKKDGVAKRRLGRNPRIPFSSHQIALLEHKFRQKQYLSSYDVTELATLLCLSQTRVKIWFQNRRARERRDREGRGGPQQQRPLSSGLGSAFQLVAPSHTHTHQPTVDPTCCDVTASCPATAASQLFG